MKNVNTYPVGMRITGTARVLHADVWARPAATTPHPAAAAAAARKRRTGAATATFVDGGTI